MRLSATLLGLAAASGTVLVLAGSPGSLAAGHGRVPPSPRTRPVAPSDSRVTSVDRLRLITGQTVLLRHRADGTALPALAGHAPYVWSRGPGRLTVVPRMPVSRLRGLDVSLFDTTALARVTRHGRTPVLIHLRRGAARPSATGLRLAHGMSRTATGAAIVHGSYGPHFRGLDPGARRQIASVRLDAPTGLSHRDTPGPTHTVTVRVSTKGGDPTDWAVVDLQSTVDGDAYFDQEDTDADGVATFTDVPDGQYSALVGTFDAILVKSQFDVSGDTALETNLGDATVKPHVTLPGHRMLSTSTNVQRDPESGWPISWGSSGSRHFDLRLQPTSAVVDHGDLVTDASTVMVTGHEAHGYDNVAMTADVADGVPEDLTYVHHRADFARMTDVFYANGPAASLPLWLIPGNMRTWMALTDVTIQQPVPGRLRVWTQAGQGHFLQQTLFPFGDDNLTQIGGTRAYHRTGTLPDLPFLHGPVGPGLELAPHSGATAAERSGNHLILSLPTMSSAGSLGSFDWAGRRDANWSLHLGRRTLAHGHEYIGRRVTVPSGPRTYRLVAATHPGRAWDLSTGVRDVWTFHSRAGQRKVALVTPTYVPPSDLVGNVRPGHTGFRLAFHSTRNSSRITRATVEISTDDGRTWRPVTVTRTSALTFHVGYRNPAAHGDRRYVSLRVTSRDAHGNTDQETAIHAYRLR